MGWASCGQDSRGRDIGYAHEARCDYPGCNRRIHRGVSYACGGMHGVGDVRSGDQDIEWGDWNCEGYFCEAHQEYPCLEHEDGEEIFAPTLCTECAAALEVAYRESDEWREHWPTDAPPIPLDAQAIEAGTGETRSRLDGDSHESAVP